MSGDSENYDSTWLVVATAETLDSILGGFGAAFTSMYEESERYRRSRFGSGTDDVNWFAAISKLGQFRTFVMDRIGKVRGVKDGRAIFAALSFDIRTTLSNHAFSMVAGQIPFVLPLFCKRVAPCKRHSRTKCAGRAATIC
jgi:hypothetical protein